MPSTNAKRQGETTGHPSGIVVKSALELRKESKMMPWERWMTETLQRGGRFVFLQDHLPNHAEQFSGAVFLSSQDLLNDFYATVPQDLVFVFDSQFSALQLVDSVLQGQRVLIGVKTPDWLEAGWGDLFLPQLTLEQWNKAREQAAKAAASRALPDFRTTGGHPCLFLDRDDVVVANVPYNNDPQKVVLTSGIAELIKKAHSKNWWVALVTNQSGLGRGKITWEEYQKVHQQMLKLLTEQGAWIDESVWAGHIENAPHAAGDFYAGLRKPRPGMFQLVDEKLKVDRKASVMIGDSASDVIAAYHAGIGQIYLVQTKRTELETRKLDSLKALLPGLTYKIIKDFTRVL